MRSEHKRTGGLNNKVVVHRHTHHSSKSTCHRAEKRVESKVRQQGKKACYET